MSALLLSCSILLSTGRNMLSKRISATEFGTGAFFLCQAMLFLFGGVSVLIFGKISFSSVSPLTVLYAVIYGALLIFAQWFYTAALTEGNTALCSTVYSLGFILPTLSGAVFWSEPFSVLDGIGILLAASAIVVSGIRKSGGEEKGRYRFFLPLIIAMLASGGLGIVQKVQQSSAYASEKSAFLLIAFAIAASASLIAFAIRNRGGKIPTPGTLALSGGVGVCFGCCNLLNTTLAGMLASAILFPTLNIGVILLTSLCGLIFLKEKITARVIGVLSLGVASILLLNLS